MRSALAWLGLKRRKIENRDRDQAEAEADADADAEAEAEASHNEDIKFDSWLSGGKGDGTAPQLNSTRYFSFEELKQYTDNFSERNKIGVGTLSVAYKGCLTNGIFVAIKRAQVGLFTGVEEFKNEIEMLYRVHHKYLVTLVGFCFEKGQRMLVFEYISNGSLRDNLDGRFGIYLDWKKRLQIALDSARGLAYLHELVNPQIIHTDINSGNILLDNNFNAKVTAFGFSKLNRDKPGSHVSSQVNQTLMRVEPKIIGTVDSADLGYINTGQLSEKTDVYDFGVVLIELITGSQPFGIDEVITAIDPHDREYYGLRDLIDPKLINEARNNGLRKFIQLALACIEDSASDRPSMKNVMKDIDIILQEQNINNKILVTANFWYAD